MLAGRDAKYCLARGEPPQARQWHWQKAQKSVGRRAGRCVWWCGVVFVCVYMGKVEEGGQESILLVLNTEWDSQNK